MIPLPDVFPAECVRNLILLVRNKELHVKKRTAFECAWNVGGWAAGMALYDDKVLPFVTCNSLPADVDVNLLSELCAEAYAEAAVRPAIVTEGLVTVDSPRTVVGLDFVQLMQLIQMILALINK